MQIPVLNGIYTDGVADFRTSYPVNMVPVPKQQGISNGYLRPADGLVQFGIGPGVDRGGINWNGFCYRVMGGELIKILSDGSHESIGFVGGSGQVTFDYSFDYLGIASSGELYLYDGVRLRRLTGAAQGLDQTIGYVVDFVWVDGYFMTTDGEFLIVTELNNPFVINPLKYGSSEADPDPVKALVKIRNEVYALNRYTIEVFDNIGGDFFPFQRIDGAQVQKGCVGTHACAMFMEAAAFVGGGRNEAPSVYIGSNSQAIKIATREVDQILATYTEAQLSQIVMEARVDKGHQHLFIHLADQTLVYDATASAELEEPVWFHLTSSLDGWSQYRARNLVWCYDKWLCGDTQSTTHGHLVENISSHYGDHVRWEFGTIVVYNEGRGAIFHELELVCLTGRVAFGDDPTISTSYSADGETWSQEKMAKVGKLGDRNKRIIWLQQGHMRNWRIQRFRGTSKAHISVARLEARVEPLAY